AALYAAGAAPRVVVSGRGGGPGEDEVGAMRRWLIARGVPAAAILDDPDGLRTIDSVRNCRGRLGMASALLVSNDFHVPRMVFLGRRLGLDAYGVAAPALVDYSSSVRWRNCAREVLARLRACLDVYL
ncbi:MAG: SanA/YdcF family protein, partial [Planctomycetota bacterium]